MKSPNNSNEHKTNSEERSLLGDLFSVSVLSYYLTRETAATLHRMSADVVPTLTDKVDAKTKSFLFPKLESVKHVIGRVPPVVRSAIGAIGIATLLMEHWRHLGHDLHKLSHHIEKECGTSMKQFLQALAKDSMYDTQESGTDFRNNQLSR